VAISWKSVRLVLRKKECPIPQVQSRARKPQHRLHGRYRRLLAKGKSTPHVVTAVARELLGFIWAIGVQVEQAQREATTRAA
jgi:hypothetical protein